MGPLIRSREEWLELLAIPTKWHLQGDTPEVHYDTGFEIIERSGAAGFWREGDTILDIGCGIGRLAIPLAMRDVRYIGVDPVAECVEFCRRVFAPWPNLRFVHIDLKNEFYNPDGTIDPLGLVFPAGDQSVDAVLFASVFTHLGTLEACTRYLDEALRVLKPGGRIGCSWFRSPPNPVCNDTSRTVFLECDIINLLKPFRVLHTESGLTDGYHDQWVMMLQKP
jgi:ubiquinone/menaquinone biosynthesis C-methylase UbiE